MEAIPRNDGEQYRFDAFCKAVLRNEARNYHRNKKRLLDREKSFSTLSLEELGKLTSVDHYPSEEFIFSSYGCDLHIDNELVANHHRQAGQRAFVLNISKIPAVTMYHVSQRTAGKLFCLSCCLDIRSERFKAGTVLNFRHSASPIYIL